MRAINVAETVMQQRHTEVIQSDILNGCFDQRGSAHENTERSKPPSQLGNAFHRGGNRAFGFGVELRLLARRANKPCARRKWTTHTEYLRF
jgi:hypothetical protein